MDWNAAITAWKRDFDCEVLPALPAQLVRQKLDFFRKIPPEFHTFYTACNGLNCEAFVVFPFHDNANLKRTWSSLERVNDPQKSEFFRVSAEPDRSALFDRFFIFARIGYEECAALERDSGKIWYQSGSDFSQLNTSLQEFIELSLREASE